MRALQHSLFACVLAASAGTGPVAAQDQPTSLWQHNNSVLALYPNRAERIFRYQEPRIAVQEEGVRPGTVFFKGTQSGNTYSGTAFGFHRHCDPIPFQLEGTLSADERRITLRGTHPTLVDDECEPIEFEDVELRISFLRAIPPPVVGAIDRAPVADKEAEERERARLAQVRADTEKEEKRRHDLLAANEKYEKRLYDLLAANDQHERELRHRQGDAERVRREREREEQRLTELRAFSAKRDACRSYNIAACETALRSPHAGAQDLSELRTWLEVAEKYRRDVDSCSGGTVAACDAALASPALNDAHRSRLNEWRTAASPFNRARVLISAYAGMIERAAAEAVMTVRNLPTSTQAAGGLAAALALALAAMALRSRHQQPASNQPKAPTPAHSASTLAAAALRRHSLLSNGSQR